MSSEAIPTADLLAVGFRRCEPSITLAGGQQANNKLELDYATLRQHPRLLGRVVSRLCDLVAPYEPDFITAVPDGANGYIDLVGLELSRREDRDVFGVYLDKPDKHKPFAYHSSLDVDIMNALDRGVILEDVINRRTSTRKALRVPGLSTKVVAVAAIFDRGISHEYTELDIPVHSVARRHIPAMLPKRSRYWTHAQ